MIGSRAWRALMWRNWVYRKRRIVGSVLELLLPLAGLIILLLIKNSLEDTSGFKPETVEETFPGNDEAFKPLTMNDYVAALQAKRECQLYGINYFSITGMPYQSFGWPVPFVKCDSRHCSYDKENATEFCEYSIFAVAPKDGDDEAALAKAGAFRTYTEQRYPQIRWGSDAVPFKHRFMQLFSSEKAIEQYVKSKDYGDTGKPKISMALVFNGGASNEYDYTIRMNSTNFNSPEEEGRPATHTTPDTELIFDTYAKADTVCETEGGTPMLGNYPDEYSCTKQYIWNGALPIQRYLHDWIMDVTGSKKQGYYVSEAGVTFSSFPTPEYVENGFYSSIAPFAPLLVMLGLLYPVAIMIRSVCQEKELRQKELMKMMSITESDIGWSWFLSYFIFHLLTATFAAMTTASLYSNSDFIFLWIFWIFSVIACIVFSFAVASLITNPIRATLIGLLVFFVGYFLTLVVNYEDDDPGRISLVSIHPVAAFSYGMQVIGALEDAGVGINSDTFDWSDLPSGYTFQNSINGLILCCIVWGFITFYVNRVMPQRFGQSMPLYFPLQLSYWCPSRARAPKEDEAYVASEASIPSEPVSEALRQQEIEGKAVKIVNMHKHFGEKRAVDGLSLSMYSGQVTALLGHNGAGKTTTINVLTGMAAPTSGYALIAGKDIRTQMTSIRQDVGICLQHDCLFPQLTVKEHLQFFASVKGVYAKHGRKEADSHVMEAISDVALMEKRHTYSNALSGGMKRKLSLAIAFIGDSNVVFLDEPTSGMDPFSRRFCWNVIRQYRQDRCIVLTTHFMDEADLLGDRIAIMAEGQLRCIGSPLFLKKSFGVGYHLTIEKVPTRLEQKSKPVFAQSENEESVSMEKDTGADVSHVLGSSEIEEKLKRIVTGSVSEAHLLNNVGTELSFQLPIGASENFVEMFEQLDEEVDNGEIVTYGVSITTLDEVFLMVARGEYGAESTKPLSSARALDPTDQGTGVVPASASHRSKMNLEESHMFSRHMRALLRKRALNFKRDKKAWCCSIILPCLLTAAGFFTVAFLAPSRNMNSITLDFDDFNTGISVDRNPIPFNTPGESACQPGFCFYRGQNLNNPTGDNMQFCGEYTALTDRGFGRSYTGSMCVVDESSTYAQQFSGAGVFDRPILAEDVLDANKAMALSKSEASQYGAVFFSNDRFSTIVNSNDVFTNLTYEKCVEDLPDYVMENECENFRGIGYVLHYNFTALHSALLYQAVADQALIKEGLGREDFTITVSVHPLPITDLEESYGEAEDSFTAWFLLVLGFPFISASFGNFVVTEKRSKAKHLQTVAGVKPSAYWFSSFFWDIINYQFPMWIVIILMYILDIQSFTTTENSVAGAAIVVLLLFGPASAGFSYLVSFFFQSASLCQLFIIVFNIFIGIAGPFVVFILRLIGYDAETNGDSTNLLDIAKILEGWLRLIPSFSLGRSLFFLINIETFKFFEGGDINAWSGVIAGDDITMLAVVSVVYIFLTILVDIWSTNPRFTRTVRLILTCRWFALCSSDPEHGGNANDDIPEDEDVVQEAQRVLEGGANEDLIVLNELTKRYHGGKLAVDHLSFGIPAGQCFGLLGINGAGKTTTMAMLTAEFPPSGGDATLAGYSVTKQPAQTRRRIGYCPQFDAHFANMTGREHVELYASIKGVPLPSIREAATAKLNELGLNDFDSDKLSSDYSGGMKRKLSVACATIGQPQIVFLDEPSTGMDPVARRDLWQVISDMVAGDGTEQPSERTSVILTTHSMEECEALCPRIAIMAGGKLRCLGSAQHLKSRYGKGFQVELKVNDIDVNDEDYLQTMSKIVELLGGEEPVGSAEYQSGRLATEALAEGEDPSNLEEGAPSAGAGNERFASLSDVLMVARGLTGDEYLASLITPENPTGYVLYKSASNPPGAAVHELASYFVEELRMKTLLEFFQAEFPDAILRERQDAKVRFEVPSEGRKISFLFEYVERNKGSLQLADYGISQTSLEQVFNMHAAEAERIKQNTTDYA